MPRNLKSCYSFCNHWAVFSNPWFVSGNNFLLKKGTNQYKLWISVILVIVGLNQHFWFVVVSLKGTGRNVFLFVISSISALRCCNAEYLSVIKTKIGMFSFVLSTSCLLKRLILERGVNGVQDVVCVLICSYLISPVIHLLSFVRLVLCQSTLDFSLLLWIMCNPVINTGSTLSMFGILVMPYFFV